MHDKLGLIEVEYIELEEIELQPHPSEVPLWQLIASHGFTPHDLLDITSEEDD